MTVIYLDSQLTLLAAANKPLATIRSTSWKYSRYINIIVVIFSGTLLLGLMDIITAVICKDIQVQSVHHLFLQDC